MRFLVLFVLMLVAFWATNIWQSAFVPYWSWSDVRLAVGFTLIFGTMVALPAVCYLLIADFIADQLRPPWSVLTYLALAAAGCAFYVVALRYGKGHPLPTTIEDWYQFWRRDSPLLVITALPLLWRLWRKIVPPK